MDSDGFVVVDVVIEILSLVHLRRVSLNSEWFESWSPIDIEPGEIS